MTVWYDIHGDGPPVVFVHAGIADSRMWEPQLSSFTPSHKVMRVDLPGFGNSPIESKLVSYRGAVREAMDAAGVEHAAIVGTSMGGSAALELALDAPERVSALVLVGPGLDDHDWSQDLDEYDEQESSALKRGDLDGAVDATLQAWVAGPRRRVEDVDPGLRDRVAEMQLNAYRLSRGHDDVRRDRLDPPASKRLRDLRVPTLVVTGDQDFDDIRQIGDRLAREIPGARRETISGAAHLPSLERPEEFDRVVLAFLAEHGV
jgi:pimeloyl-ACP methyl ester carboxylesterase